jgi:TldD protein
VKKLVVLALLAFAVMPFAASSRDDGMAYAKKKPPPKLGGPSTAVTNEILDAVAEEMNRAMTSLHVGRAPGPYHVSYKITEVDVNDVVASLGYASFRKNRHFVTIDARVRVRVPDAPEIDNGNFVVAGGESIDGVATFPLPLEATPRIARRAAWLVTDAAYKEALAQLRAKLDARASSGGGNAVPGWSDSPPLVQEEAVLVPELESLESMEKRAAAVSQTLRERDLRDSRVAFTSYLERRWYLSSDGTSATDTRRVSGVLIAAIGQADDGQDLAQYYTRYGHTAADLPKDDDLIAAAKQLADTVDALRKAPVVDRYTGPVLFEGEGATDIVRYTLAPHLGGTPLPEGLRPQDAKQFGGALKDKVGLKVLAGNLSIVDDPTAAEAAGKALIGGYRIDDEGVAAKKVSVVEGGMLKELLRSRTPSKKGETSNGHARRTAPGGMFHGTATNLILTGKGGLDRKKLVAKLLSEAKSNGLGFGIVVRQMDDAAITGQPEMTRRELLAMFQNTDTDLPPPANLVYKVYPGGKEELVRLAQIGEVPIRVWKDVIAVGKTQTVKNFLAQNEGYIVQKINGAAEGAVPSSGIESAVATPDLLFKELDITPYTIGQRAKPAVPRPSAGASAPK